MDRVRAWIEGQVRPDPDLTPFPFRRLNHAASQSDAPYTHYELWSSEPFVFSIDEKGQPVNTAGDYAAIRDFDYEEVVEQVASAKGKMLAAPHAQRFTVAMSAHGATREKASAGRVTKIRSNG